MEKNKFSQTSIKNKIVLRFTLLVTVFLFLTGATFSFLIIKNLEEEAHKTLEKRALLIQNKIEERISYLIKTTELLAKNGLMVNSLVDEDGRKEYLTPLSDNFMDDKDVKYLNIVDFDGKIIFKTSNKVPEYNKSTNLRRALAMGAISYYLEKDSEYFTVIVPMKYYNTTQGALIATFDINKILDKYILKDNSEYMNIIYNDKIIYSDNFTQNEKYYSYLLKPEKKSLFNSLEIELKIGKLESSYLSPIKDALFTLAFLGFIFLAIGIIVSYFLAISVTNPILKLYNRIREETYQTKYESLGTNDELEILSKLFYEKTNKLYESENLTQSVINNIEDFIFYKDKDFKYMGCNEAFLKYAGKTKDELIGSDDFELFDYEMASLFRKMDIQMLKDNKSKSNNEWVTFPNQDKIYLQTLKSPFHYNETNVGILGVSRDITEFERLKNDEIEKQKIILQQSKMASMGEMIGNIAHQWRQPLSVISTASTGMKVKEEFGLLEKKELASNCDLINDQAQYLSKTIDDFRNFIKGTRIKQKFNIKDEINSFLSLISGTMKSNNVNIIINIDDDIKIDGYANELIQCLINVFNNSKDVLKEIENIQRYFFISTYKKDNNVVIELKDNGGGIPDKVLPHVFEPYYTTKHSSQGTGLGLHMSYNLIVDGMNGIIEADNETYIYEDNEYTGALFRIILPLN